MHMGLNDISSSTKVELRGFAPIGMLEYWNTGIMGFGEIGHWFTLLNRVPLGNLTG